MAKRRKARAFQFCELHNWKGYGAGWCPKCQPEQARLISGREAAIYPPGDVSQLYEEAIRGSGMPKVVITVATADGDVLGITETRWPLTDYEWDQIKQAVTKGLLAEPDTFPDQRPAQ